MTRCPEGTEGKPWIALLVAGVCMILTYAAAFHGLRSVVGATGRRCSAWMALDVLLAAACVALGVGGALAILLRCFPE